MSKTVTRVALILLLLVALSFPLFSNSRFSVGYGSTLEEAKLSARTELANSIQTKISSITKAVYSESTQKGETVTLSSFYEHSELSTDIKLFGISYRNEHYDNNIYSIEAFIDSSSLSQYVQKVNLIVDKIKELEASFPTEEVDYVSDYTKIESYYSLLLYQYEEYELYSSIALLLDAQVLLPKLEKTRVGVELDYSNFLSEAQSALEREVSSLERKTSSSFETEIIKEQAKVGLAEVEKLIATNLIKMRVMEEESRSRKEEFQRQLDSEIRSSSAKMRGETLKRIEALKSVVDSENPLEFIKSIEEKKVAYSEIQNGVLNLYYTQSEPIIREYTKRISEERERPFRDAEMIQGEPTEAAVAFREQRVKSLQDSLDKELAQIKERIESSVENNLLTIKDEVLKEFAALENKSFSLDSVKDEISIRIGEFDAYRLSWQVAIRFKVLGVEFKYDLYVPYTSITGKTTPPLIPSTEKEIALYYEYLDEVDLFNSFFFSVDSPLIWDFEYSVIPTSEGSTYLIMPKEYSLKRSDNLQIVFTPKEGEIDDTIGRYIFSPRTQLPFSYTSMYEKEIEKRAEKEVKKERYARWKKSPLTRMRSGMFVGFSISKKDNTVDDSSDATLGDIHLALNFQPHPLFYYGAEIVVHGESEFVTTESPFYPYGEIVEKETVAYFGLTVHAGITYPITIKKSVLNPFAEIGVRCTFKKEQFDLVSTIGASYTFPFEDNKDFFGSLILGLRYSSSEKISLLFGFGIPLPLNIIYGEGGTFTR